MNTKITCLIASLVIITLLSACGPSPVEQAETATQVAANSNATLTALAPTATSTYTPTPIPTSTATPTATATRTLLPTKTATVTPTPAPMWWDAVPVLGDLPQGFRSMTEDELSPIEVTMPAGAIVFGFVDEVRTQALMGYYMPLLTRAEQLTFDDMLPETVDFLATSTGSTQEPVLISGMDDIGDSRHAVTFLTDGGGFNLRWELTVFRRGEVAAFLYIFYPDGDEPAALSEELARLLDQRIAGQTPSSDAGNTY